MPVPYTPLSRVGLGSSACSNQIRRQNSDAYATRVRGLPLARNERFQ